MTGPGQGPGGTLRLFVAVDPPGPLEAVLLGVRESVDPGGSRARWNRAGSIHLTLRFLGSVGEDRVGSIRRALETIRTDRVDVRVRGVGFFPNERAPRVFWAGIESARLAGLAEKVELAMVGVGFPREPRPFKPHLTLARASRQGVMGRDLVDASKMLGETDFGSFTTCSFVLYRSRLEGSGAVYEKLAEFVFAETNPE